MEAAEAGRAALCTSRIGRIWLRHRASTAYFNGLLGHASALDPHHDRWELVAALIAHAFDP